MADTLDGRFLVLSLHLFAILHRLKGHGRRAFRLAQELTDRFSADMEAVLREIGIGDLAIPKKVRGLATSSMALLQAYDEALPMGEKALAGAIYGAFNQCASAAATSRLAHYLTRVIEDLRSQSLAALEGGEVRFPAISSGELPGDDPNAGRH